MRLQGKVVFLSDADSPSGKAILSRMSEEGARLLLVSDSNGAGISGELELCRARGTHAHVDSLDLCDGGQINRLLDMTEGTLGAVDVLVHNRSLILPASVETCDERIFSDTLNANAKSAFIVSQAIGARMAARGAGTIVFVGSIHAEKPTGSAFAYSAAKGAVQMLSREASLALGRHGVNVNHIQMGPVRGDNAVFRSDISTLYEDYEYKAPSTELATHQDLASLIVYLAGSEAKHLNGADFRLDGGFLNHYLDVKMNMPSSGGES